LHLTLSKPRRSIAGERKLRSVDAAMPVATQNPRH